MNEAIAMMQASKDTKSSANGGDKMAYYMVKTGNGNVLCDGVSEHEIKRTAQAWADRLAETVYYSESGTGPDLDEDEGVAVKPRLVCCECGQYTGERCIWVGSPDDTVIVEFMPMHYRASHKAARNVGVYPHNGAVRIRCERSCAESIVKLDPDWTRIL